MNPNRWIRPLAVLLIALAGPALGQNVIDFAAQTTTGTETVTPVLSWSTTPLADDCTASGDWSGAKGPSGSETLAPISQGATYNLTCSWSENSATLSWTAPTENTDGSPLTDLAGFKIYYGQASGVPYDSLVEIANPDVTSTVVEGLSAGTWFFAATAVNARGIESDFSNEASKTVAGELSSQQSVGITVNPRPAAPGGLSVQ